ncbi:hypothetical protein NERG_00153 [Nematocida ausubeli]|uniref:Uncharacterized protein n=1 Tax=Nematocida ausubeli (strain ATCC PRA-371 / ERTm2) TaxID=1913371 RepID=H8Z982_NEMA1|nr:hypothetical protein NERG_00153 [Nematocida ausubeli]
MGNSSIINQVLSKISFYIEKLKNQRDIVYISEPNVTKSIWRHFLDNYIYVMVVTIVVYIVILFCQVQKSRLNQSNTNQITDEEALRLENLARRQLQAELPLFSDDFFKLDSEISIASQVSSHTSVPILEYVVQNTQTHIPKKQSKPSFLKSLPKKMKLFSNLAVLATMSVTPRSVRNRLKLEKLIME